MDLMKYLIHNYSDLKISQNVGSSDKLVGASLKLRNSGSRSGAEVVELYVHDGHSSTDRPVQELKGFLRVSLAPGETKEVQFTLDRSATAFYSTSKQDWVTEPGQFDLLIGPSSRDIRLTSSFIVKP